MTKELVEKLTATIGYCPPGFTFYPDDYFGSPSVGMMLPEQEGAYVRLLAYCWQSNRLALTSDPRQLAVMSKLNDRWTDLGPLVLSCFEQHPLDGPGWLTNAKLIEVRYTSMVRAVSGASGGSKRQAKGQQNDSKTSSEIQAPCSLSPVPCSESLVRSTREKIPPSAVGLELASHLRTRVLKTSPHQVIDEKRLQDWGREIDRIMRLDKRTPEQMRAVIDYAHNDNAPGPVKPGHRQGFCWASVTLSPSKLRNPDLWGQFDAAKNSGPRQYVPRELRQP